MCILYVFVCVFCVCLSVFVCRCVSDREERERGVLEGVVCLRGWRGGFLCCWFF